MLKSAWRGDGRSVATGLGISIAERLTRVGEAVELVVQLEALNARVGAVASDERRDDVVHERRIGLQERWTR